MASDSDGVSPTGSFWHKAAVFTAIRQDACHDAKGGRALQTMRCLWGCLVLAGCLGDSDPPEILSFTPRDGVDRAGIQSISVDVTYRDASSVTTRVFVDGELVATADPDCDDDGACTSHYDWDTIPFSAGMHDLTVALEDLSGNVSDVTHQVALDDVLVVTAMEVQNIYDESGTLEIEVYAFDENRTMIGCAGSRHGLHIVENSTIAVSTEAVLITPDTLAFGTNDVGNAAFSLEVWEDDDEPVCPDLLLPEYNDLVGVSPLMTVDQWRSMPQISFGNVALLGTSWGRPLRETDIVDPPRPDPDPYFDDGRGGCSAGAGGTHAGLALLVAMPFGFGRRRRRVAA